MLGYAALPSISEFLLHLLLDLQVLLGTVDVVYSRLRSFACRANSMFTNPRHNDFVLNSEKERGRRALQSSATSLLFDLTVKYAASSLRLIKFSSGSPLNTVCQRESCVPACGSPLVFMTC